MELQSRAALAWQLYRSLLRKNAVLAWRHRRSSALQLLSSLVFIFLIFCIDRAIRSRISYTTAYRNVPNPEALVAPPIPPCEDKFFVKSPCYDFLRSDGGSARVAGLVDAIRRNNPGRPIPSGAERCRTGHLCHADFLSNAGVAASALRGAAERSVACRTGP